MSRSVLNIRLIGQGHVGFFVFFYVHDTAWTSWPGFMRCCTGIAHGHYLALSKASNSCFYLKKRIFNVINCFSWYLLHLWFMLPGSRAILWQEAKLLQRNHRIDVAYCSLRISWKNSLLLQMTLVLCLSEVILPVHTECWWKLDPGADSYTRRTKDQTAPVAFCQVTYFFTALHYSKLSDYITAGTGYFLSIHL